MEYLLLETGDQLTLEDGSGSLLLEQVETGGAVCGTVTFSLAVTATAVTFAPAVTATPSFEEC